LSDHPMRRESDRSKASKVKVFAQEWGWAVTLVGAIALTLGYRYVTPADEIQAIKAEQGVLKDAVDTLNRVTRGQASDINAITRLQCFNDNYTTKQLNLVGIHCDGIRP
jgi:hypothetical protein